MSEQDPMDVNERRKYLHKMRIRYWQVQDKTGRGKLLDEMEEVTGQHRKSLLRLIHGELARKPRTTQRGKTYGIAVDMAIATIARSLDYPCAERLQPNLVWMADHLAKHEELDLSADVRERLQVISASSVRRRLPQVQQVPERIAAPRKAAHQAFPAKQSIPVRRIDWQEKRPGHFETDLVHHGGNSTEGQYVHTLQLLDVATGWSECVGVLGRSYLVMRDGFEHISSRLPFAIHEIHPDNGSEFLNQHMLNYWHDKVQAEVSRSRPFYKNDNRFVEENNSSLVRAYIGYARLDTVAQTKLLNQLYDQLWLYHNLFQPVMKLSEKHWQDQKLKRIYDEAIPPLDRLCKTDMVAPSKKQELLTLRNNTNPMKLRVEIQNLLDQLYALPCAKEGVVEDVHLSLFRTAEGESASVVKQHNHKTHKKTAR